MSNIFSKDIAVLDVGSHTLSAIVGTKKAQTVFGIKAVAERQHQGYENARWYDLADTMLQVKAVLSEAMKSASSRTKRLFIGVPAEFAAVVTREVEVDYDKKRLISDDDIDYILGKGNSFEVGGQYMTVNMSAIGFRLDDKEAVYSDIRGYEAKSVKALISYVLAEKSYIDSFDKVAEELGFTDVRYLSTEWAQCMSLLEQEQRDEVYAMLDIGYLSSSMCVAKGDGLLDLKAFSMGGAHISADITEYLGVSFEMAEEARKLVDLNLTYDDDAVLVSGKDEEVKASYASQLAKERLEMFAEIIGGIIADHPDLPPYAAIYLTGEGIGSMRGAKKYLGELLGRNIELITSRLPGFVKPEDSSKASLLVMADSLSKTSVVSFFKRLFSGGKK